MTILRRTLFGLSFFALGFTTRWGSTFAKGGKEDIETVKDASDLMVAWFQDLLNAGASIADYQFKEKLKSALKELDKKLFLLKTRKLDFIELLKEPAPTQKDIKRAIDNLQESVRQVRDAVQKVNTYIGQEYQDKGRKVEKLLWDAAFENKAFVLSDSFKYEMVIGDKATFISKSEQAKEAVERASEELQKLY